MEKIRSGSTAPLASLPPSLLYAPPQAVAARATMVAPVTHLALLAPRMGFLLMSPLVDYEGHSGRFADTPDGCWTQVPRVCS
ncbi:hypothetical protein STANM309S_06248 [Streptomyces tanashiensis]